MSRQTMIEAIRTVPKAPSYGIVITRFDDQPYEYEVSWQDAERDFEWALNVVREAGIGPDDWVLVTTPNHELPWTNPFLRAFREVGATYVPAEQHSWDSRRFLTVLKRLPITVVFGLWPETLASVAAQETHLSTLFADVRLIWARPEAHRELERAGVESLPMVTLGPALGLGVPNRDGVVVNDGEWEVAATDTGALVVSTRPERHSQMHRVPTGVHGRVGRDSDGHTVIHSQ